MRCNIRWKTIDLKQLHEIFDAVIERCIYVDHFSFTKKLQVCFSSKNDDIVKIIF